MKEPSSPTTTFRPTRSMGPEKFNQRREMFDQANIVILPKKDYSKSDNKPKIIAKNIQSDWNNDEKENDVILRSELEHQDNKFSRTPAYSSMRESHTPGYRSFLKEHKLSELSPFDDQIEYRNKLMSERTKRISRLRSEFLASNLHSNSADPFKRNQNYRASLPARSLTPAKVEFKPYKFQFAEPFTTPQPIRKQFLSFDDEENNEIVEKPPAKRHQSLAYDPGSLVIDHQKVFKELMEKYSPPRKAVDWDFPATKPQVFNEVQVYKTCVENGSNGVKVMNPNIVNAVEKPPRKIVPRVHRETRIPEILDKLSAEPQINGTISEKKPKKKRNFFAKLFGRNKK